MSIISSTFKNRLLLSKYLILILIAVIVQKSNSFIVTNTIKESSISNGNDIIHYKQKHSSYKPKRKDTNKIRPSSMILQVLSTGEELVSNSIWEDVATTIVKIQYPSNTEVSTPQREKLRRTYVTILRVGLPSTLAGITSFALFPYMSLYLSDLFNDEQVLFVLSTDSSQFIQDMQVVVGFLFSLLIGQTYYFMYKQQESIYTALFSEVSEAKSLLEQVSLVCQGRGFYEQVLESIKQYVDEDLKKLQSFEPAVLLSKRPSDDPLESIMYMTSVGLPGTIYDTVRSLRQARAERLGALQRKLPSLHLVFLWLLAILELLSFPVLGSGVQTVGGYNILTVEGLLFGVMATGVVMVMLVVYELYRPSGGAYNVDGVLGIMVRGMEEELALRMRGGYGSNSLNPTPEKFDEDVSNTITMDGQLVFDLKQEDKAENEVVKKRSRVNRWVIKNIFGWLQE